MGGLSWIDNNRLCRREMPETFCCSVVVADDNFVVVVGVGTA
jgi:hypothetical protein